MVGSAGRHRVDHYPPPTTLSSGQPPRCSSTKNCKSVMGGDLLHNNHTQDRCKSTKKSVYRLVLRDRLDACDAASISL